MKKTFSVVLMMLLVVSIFAAKTTTQPILSYISPFVIEKTEYEATGVIEQVVLGVYGRGYATVSYGDGEKVKIPFIWNRYSDVKIGTEVSFKGIKATILVPTSVEVNGYKIVLRPVKNSDNVKMQILETKVKSVEVSRNAVTIALTDSQNKEYRIPGSLMPIWKTLKVGDIVKLNTIKRNINAVQSITIDGKTYNLSYAIEPSMNIYGKRR
ncbi:MAG TPA: hypothetical protein PK065_06640 [Fervidobacterium sp.]|nr:hypothetical protein [Fervidobacterium sp.]